MTSIADDPWAGANTVRVLDDPWSEAEPPEHGANVVWAGRPVSVRAVRSVAERAKTTPDVIARLGTLPGRIESAIAETAPGAVALSVAEGFRGVADTAVSLGARAVAGAQHLLGLDTSAADNLSKRVHDMRQKRREFLSFIQQRGAVREAMDAIGLGERGTRVFNSTLQSLTEVGLAAGVVGPTAVYSYVVGRTWDDALSEGEDAGLSGGDLLTYAAKQTLIEGGITYLAGRLGHAVGLKSLEESFSPGVRAALRKSFFSQPVRDKLRILATELGGVASEAVEEMLISAGQQINEMEFGLRSGFSWDELLESGAGGVFGRGAIGAVRGLTTELRALERKLPEIVAGARAAEIDIERGLNPLEVRDYVADAEKFDKQTGRAGTTQQFRDSYRDALEFYIAEMRNEGKQGALAKLEEDVRRLREEERQREARVSASKSAAKKRNKGKTGESLVKMEPVREPELQTANDRATFNLFEFEALVAKPHIGEALTAPQPTSTNPYLLAPWETETRTQRRIRRLQQQNEEYKNRLKTLREQFYTQKKLTQQQQQDAFDLVRRNIPTSEQHKFFRDVLKATRPSTVDKLLNRVEKYIAKRDHALAVDMLREAFRKAGNLRAEFAETVRDMRSRLSMSKFRGERAARVLQKWARENRNAILTERDEAMLDRLTRVGVWELTTDELTDLAATVERLAYQSALQDKLIFQNTSASVRDLGDEIVREMQTAPPKTKLSDSIVEKLRSAVGRGTFSAEQHRDIVSLFLREGAERPEVTLRSLSKTLTDSIYGRMLAARREYNNRTAVTYQLLRNTFEKLGIPHDPSLVASLRYRAGLPSSPLENWRSARRKIGGVELTRGEAWWIHLSNRDPHASNVMLEAGWKLSGGRTLTVTPQVLAEIAEFVGDEGNVLAETAFDHLNTFVIDGVNEAHEKWTGRPLTDKRNVVPIVRSESEYASLLTKSRTGFFEAMVDSYSHLRKRSGKIAPLEIPDGLDGIDMFMAHSQRMHRYAAYVVPARNAELLLNDDEVKKAIVERNGVEGYDHIVSAIRAEAAGYVVADDVARQLSAWNHTAAGAMVGLRLPIMMVQALDALVAAPYEKHGFKDMLDGLRELTIRGPAKMYREMKEVLGSSSGEWQHRYEHGNYASQITNGLFQQPSYFRPPSLVEQAADSLKLAEQAMPALVNYLAAKAAVRRQWGLDRDDFGVYDARGSVWTDAVVSQWELRTVRGSNSSHGLELSGALQYAKRNPLAGLVLNFYNTSSKVYSLFSMAHEHLRAGRTSEAVPFVAAGVANAVLFSAIGTALTQSDKEKRNPLAWRLLARAVSNMVSLVPGGQILADEVAFAVFNMPKHEGDSVLLAEIGLQACRSAAELGHSLGEAINGATDREQIMNDLVELGRSAGPMLGIPTPAVVDLFKRIQKRSLFTGLQPAPEKPFKPL